MDHHCDQFPISLIQDNCIKTHQHNSYIEDYEELLSKITLARTNRPSVGLDSSPRPSTLLRFLRFLSCLFFLLSIFLSIFLPSYSFPSNLFFFCFYYVLTILTCLQTIFSLFPYWNSLPSCNFVTYLSNPILQFSWSHN